MNELKNWEKQPAKNGTFINLYRAGADHAIFCRVVQSGFFRGVEGPQVTQQGGSPTPSPNDMWCEVPEPPSWQRVLQRKRSDELVTIIRDKKTHLSDLEAESRKLHEEMAQADAAEQRKDSDE